MKRSELYARYHHWQNELIEIDDREFNINMVADNKDNISFEEDGLTYVTRIRLEGYDYYCFSSCWSVGWQGDIDSDQFYCKIKTFTMAEIEDIIVIL